MKPARDWKGPLRTRPVAFGRRGYHRQVWTSALLLYGGSQKFVGIVLNIDREVDPSLIKVCPGASPGCTTANIYDGSKDETDYDPTLDNEFM